MEQDKQVELAIINKWGFTWRIGQPWGVAHPAHNCYTGGDAVTVNEKNVELDVLYDPKTVMIDGSEAFRVWNVGMVSSYEPIKYGNLHVVFKLPRGRNLWPAIWLADNETWPPEIDIVEGWTNNRLDSNKCYRKMCGKIPVPFTNDIFPSLHYGNSVETHKTKSYRNLFKGTCSSLLNVEEVNDCHLIWEPDRITVFWNFDIVLDETDKDILSWFNTSNGMRIILNNYVTNDFTNDDYRNMDEVDRKMQIMALSYQPLD